MRLLRLLLVITLLISYAPKTYAQLNLQLMAEEQYPVFLLGIGGISGLTPLVDKLDRPYVYVASNEGGLKIYETDPILNLVQVIDTNILIDKVTTLEQVDTLLYVGTGNIFQDTLAHIGLSIVNIADPQNPIVMDNWWDPNSNDTISSGAGVIRIQGDYAFIGGMSEGMVILNISDPNAITFVSKFQPDITYPLASNDPKKVNARGMAIDGDLVYLCYDQGGVRVIDCSTISIPVEVAAFSNPITYAVGEWPRAYNNIVLDDTVAYVAADYCGLEVWSIADPLNAQLLAHWNPHDCPVNGWWWEAPVHVNEMILQRECDMLFMSTGKSEMIIMDVADPYMPFAIDSFGTVLDTTITWGIDITDDRIYLTYAYVSQWLVWPLVPFYSNWNGIKQLSYTNCGLGIKEEEFDFTISPNPAYTTLEIEGLTGSYIYDLVDITGKIVQQGSGVNDEQLDVSLLKSGAYFIRITKDEHRVQKKLLIE